MKTRVAIALLLAVGFISACAARVPEPEAIAIGKQALSDLIVDVNADTLQWSAQWEHGQWYVKVVPLPAWKPANDVEAALRFPMFVSVSASGRVTGRMYE